jgi:hypothetical protein
VETKEKTAYFLALIMYDICCYIVQKPNTQAIRTVRDKARRSNPESWLTIKQVTFLWAMRYCSSHITDARSNCKRISRAELIHEDKIRHSHDSWARNDQR